MRELAGAGMTQPTMSPRSAAAWSAISPASARRPTSAGCPSSRCRAPRRPGRLRVRWEDRVDLPEAKNYVGAYHLPAAVLTDPSLLSTLAEAELAAGFVEVIKTALIAGGGLWDIRAIDELDPASLDEVIFACAAQGVVAADERDSGLRQVLNLGHTAGHAIEAAGGYSRYRHGEAIGLGLLASLRLSDADDLREEVGALLARHGLPTELAPDVDVDEVLAALARDKKRTAEVPFVLLAEPGAPRPGAVFDG